MSKTRRILEPFFNPFWDDFQGFGKVKNKGFVWEGCIFSDYQVFREKVRFDIDFGRVLGRVLGGFWTSKTEKKAFKRDPKRKPKKKHNIDAKILLVMRGRRHGGGPRERRIRTRTWTIKFSTPLHPSVGRGRRILKREALCRQLLWRFRRLGAVQIDVFGGS